MSQQQTQETGHIFQPTNKLIIKQWKKMSTQKKILKFITVDQLPIFIKNVFLVSKDQLEMDIDEETNFQQIVEDYLDFIQKPDKNKFTYEEAVKILNWAVEQEEEEQKQIQQNKPKSIIFQQKTQKEPSLLEIQKNQQPAQEQQETQQKIEIKQPQQKIVLQQPQQKIELEQPLKIQKPETHKIIEKQEPKKITLKKIPTKKLINQKSIKQIPKMEEQKVILTLPLRQPVSIKRQLAKIDFQKEKNKLNQKRINKNHLDQLYSPEVKYFKRQRIVIKNKKPKPQFHPQNMGLKELFKFYCCLHSQHSYKKSKDNSKSIFEQIKSKGLQLYMHNFMLLCKDFSIVQTKKPTNSIKIKITAVSESNVKETSGSRNMNKKLTKGSVPSAVKQPKEKDSKNSFKQTEKTQQAEDVWDRDKLSGYFKKQADYNLNVKYDVFIQIIKYILRIKIAVQSSQTEQNFDESPTNDQQNQVDPVILNICKFFKVDTDQNCKETMNKLKLQYKIIDEDFLKSTKAQQKKLIGEINPQFKGSVQQQLKIRQIQKQKQRIQAKKRYLEKYSSQQNDIYSSFKAANNFGSSSNGIYGSTPKLNSYKLNCTDPIYSPKSKAIDSDFSMHELRKNISQNFHSGTQIGSILKDARREVMSNKQNPYNMIDQGSKLSKSRFNPFQLQRQKAVSKDNRKQKKIQDDEMPLSSILANRSRLIEEENSKQSPKAKNKTKDINSPLLQRMGCNQDDELLDKYFNQEKNIQLPYKQSNYR